jgi:hypothetical protein
MAKSVVMQSDGMLKVDDDIMQINRHAASQLFQKVGMPSRYFVSLLREDPELTAWHFNKVYSKQPPEELLVRTKTGTQTYEDDDEQYSPSVPVVRGVLSDLYSMLDNDMVVEGLSKVISQFTDEYQILTHHLDSKRMHIRITFPSTARQIGFTKDNIGDILQVGIDIINSEVGLSSLNIAGLIWRLVCANGLRRVMQGESYVQRHMYLNQPEFLRNMGFSMTQAIESSVLTMKNFTESKRIELIRPQLSMKVIGDRFKLTNAIVERAQESWEHDATVYGIINSFTAAARGLKDSYRLELERTSGKLLSFSPKEWKRIDTLAEQYED